ncbi:DUF4249 domain-containing protein [Flavobacterium cerinum]|uniref:DUF4249 domain-containing protein n=1 Tax=Flavobacterium cerinum TaxID=2502784 RepID=A0ABY5IRZ3_9FLAO|nr:DUF4249 domain-containing protein [Flavobacterium cerinum]UUC44312.1 DUF4249 domain-containing protein [Flavobacterium cerinum]
MKTILKYCSFLFAVLLMSSCEEVVDVKLDTAPPRLVVDAAINWIKGTTGSEQTIYLTTTADYFGTEIPKVSGATVFITNSSNVDFPFLEVAAGEYSCTNFQPVLGETYTLTVVAQGVTYKATEKMISVPSIQNIEQKNDGGFTGDQIELKTYYNDPGDEDNYYLFRYIRNSTLAVFRTSDDRFVQGNTTFDIYSHEDLEANDKVNIRLMGISRQYYNYMNILISVVNGGGGPFQTPPATVRGNVINQNNQANYPLGYFSLSEVDETTYTVQ